jgi:hypothetical protein
MLVRSPEHRKAVRRPSNRSARICVAGGGLVLPCRIWDISESGARLKFTDPPPSDLPHHFTLQLAPDWCVRWDCEVAWTNAGFIGVRFTGLAS